MAKTKVQKAETLPAVVPPAQVADWEKQLATEAKDERSTFATGVSRLTVESFKFCVDKEVIGEEVLVAVIETAWAKEYWTTPYVRGQPGTPDCFGFGKKEKGIVPHAEVKAKQAEDCDHCPHNKFNTAEFGRGKRCKDKPRIMVILAHDLQGKPDDAAKRASCYQLSIPPTSLKNFNDYLGFLRDATPNGNIREALTRIKVQVKQGTTYHEFKFEFVGLVPKGAMPALLSRQTQAYEQMTQPFPDMEVDAAPPVEAKPVKGQGRRR